MLGRLVQLRLLVPMGLVLLRFQIPNSRSSDVGDAFGDLFHGILVHLGLGVEAPEVLQDPESLAVLFWHAEDG